jgi:tRNA(Ile)-lysidine synthase
MGDYARAQGIAALLTAHTLDDQAETLLMRLARGSGLDGLAAIAPSLQLDSLRIVRPLLEVPKSRLQALLEQRGIRWIEDPSNQSPAFERTRLRAARSALDALGLTGDKLASSARRLQRARAALDSVTDGLCAAPPAGIVNSNRCGLFRIDQAQLMRTPEEIVLRVLTRCIAAAGGSDEPVPLGKLEPIVASLRRSETPKIGSWTLARALITCATGTVQVEREPGRHPPPRLVLAGGSRALWDRRFAIDIAESFDGSLEVRALGAEGLAELRRLGVRVKGTRALQLAPAFWRQGMLLAVPSIDYWSCAELERLISASFVGLQYNTGMPPKSRAVDCGASRG